jgi:hypothetical protein
VLVDDWGCALSWKALHIIGIERGGRRGDAVEDLSAKILHVEVDGNGLLDDQ